MYLIIEIIGLILMAIAFKIIMSKRAQIRGVLGEKKVKQQLEKVKLENYRVLNDIMLKTEKGTSQIDHIVISPYGFMVIETKNYRGWIYGSEEGDYWTQVLNKHTKQRFRNPIKQNWGHICALKEVLQEFKDYPFHSIIVLAGSAKFKTTHDVKTPVIHPEMLYDTILSHRGIAVLSQEEIDKLFNLLKELSLDDKEARQEHILQARRSAEELKNKQTSIRCPWCNRPLVKRTGKNGEFYGCTRFPKCKYTIQYSD